MSDVVVIGAGLAGLSAALRLAEAGRSVIVVAKGVGSLHLGGGTIDVLGYAPEPVVEPRAGLAALVAARPDHPYALVGPELVADAAGWLRDRAGAVALTGDLDGNLLLPTAIGALKPSAIAPAALAAADLRGGGSLLVVGLRSFKDFHAGYCAENLAAAAAARGLDVEVRSAILHVIPDRRADIGSLDFARAFDDDAFRAEVARELRTHVDGAGIVALPAVLGLRAASDAIADLEQRLGVRVAEIATLPPSVPGVRLFSALRDTLVAAGGRIVLGAEVESVEAEGGRLAAVRTISASGRAKPWRAASFVLASGGFSAGGLTLDASWQARETIAGLPVHGVPDDPDAAFAVDPFAEHPLTRSGLRVDARLRPLAADGGEPVYENLHAAGSLLAGAAPWRELCGNGVALATGYAAAARILEETA